MTLNLMTFITTKNRRDMQNSVSLSLFTNREVPIRTKHRAYHTVYINLFYLYTFNIDFREVFAIEIQAMNITVQGILRYFAWIL